MGDVADLYDWIDEHLVAKLEPGEATAGIVDTSKTTAESIVVRDMLEHVPPQMRRDPLVSMLVTIISNGVVCPPSYMDKWKAAYERALERAAVQS